MERAMSENPNAEKVSNPGPLGNSGWSLCPPAYR